jgi:pimeloyl-ACP methyl ester carboxylesterase
MAGLFEKEYANTLVDLPGFGKTPMLKEGASTADYADALAKQLSAGKQHILVGHSYGGRVAVQLASKYPDLVKAIILIGGAGLKRKRSIVFRAKASAIRFLGRVARLSDALFKTRYRDAYVTRFGSADYKAAGDLRATLVSAVTEDLSPQARAVKCPALMIYGSNDTDAPPEIGKKFEKLIPISRYEELKGYDHHDILSRGAYQCEAIIRNFLQDVRND